MVIVVIIVNAYLLAFELSLVRRRFERNAAADTSYWISCFFSEKM